MSLRLSSIRVDGLFGVFNHFIPLNLSDRMTIIYGPNGFGKTTVLRMVAHVFAPNFQALQRVAFDRMILEFTDGSHLTVVKREQQRLLDDSDDGGGEEFLGLTVQLQSPDSESTTFDVRFDERRSASRAFRDIDRELPVTRIGARQWQHEITGELFSLRDLAERYGDFVPSLAEFAVIDPELEAELDRLPVHLIETQRLLPPGFPREHPRRDRGFEPNEFAPAVERYSADISQVIQTSLAESTQITGRLDRTFPSRLLDYEVPPDATEERVRERYAVQGDRRAKLMQAALLDPGMEVDLPGRELDSTELRVLWLYLDDVEQKLSAFDELLESIELFKDVINSRFEFKKLEIDKERGFFFQPDSGAAVSPSDLSSGEQHELVLTYQLLFTVPKGSLVLIDEPEISLHVSWQQKFLDDLERISTTANLDFLIATHSPQIIHDRWDLAVELSRPSS